MGRIFAKNLLKWREPASIRHVRERIERQTESSWLRPVLCLVVTGSLLAFWYAATLNPQKNPPSFPIVILLATLAGPLFVYGLPLLYKICPSEIRITDHGVIHTVGNRIRLWKYQDIKECVFLSEQTENQTINAIAITTKRNKTTVLGIAASVKKQQVSDALASQDQSLLNANERPTDFFL